MQKEADSQAVLQQKLQDAESECEKLRGKAEDLQQKVSEATNMSANALVERERLQAEFQRCQQQTTGELEVLRATLKEAGSSHEQTRTELMNQVDSLRTRAVELEEQLKQSTASADSLTLTASASNAGGSSDGDQQKIKDLENRLATKTEEVDWVRAEAAATAERLAIVEGDMQKLKASTESSDESMQSMRTDLLAATKDKEHLSEECDKVKGELTSARFEMEVKAAEYERLRTESASGASSIDEIKRLQTKLVEDRDAGEAAVQMVVKEKMQAVEEVAELKGEVDVLSAEFAKKAAETVSLSAEKLQAEEQLQVKSNNAETLGKELAVLREETKQLRDASSSRSTEMDAKASSDLLQLRSECDKLQAELEKTRGEAQTLANTKVEMEVKLETQQKECQRLCDAAAESSKAATDSLQGTQSECQRLRDAAAESSRAAAETLQGVQRRLEEESKATALSKSDAAVASRELAVLKTELDSRTAECERLHAKVSEGSSRSFDEVQQLQGQLGEERGLTAQAKAEVAAGVRELSMLKTELDMRTKECERMQVKAMDTSRSSQEELQRAQSQLAAQVRETSALRSELDVSNGESKRLQERVLESSSAIPEEVRRLQSQLEEGRRTSAEDVRHMRSQLEDERESLAQVRLEASTSCRELASSRAELETRTAECVRLRADAGVSPETIQRLQARLEEEYATVAQAKADAASSQRDLVAVRVELEAKATECVRMRSEVASGTQSSRTGDEVRRLQAQLEEDRGLATRAQAEASAVQARQIAETSALSAELDARSAECGRMRAELVRLEHMAHGQNEVRELASLRAQLVDQRAELDMLRQQSHRLPSVSQEEERSLRAMVRERDDGITQLKADAAQTASLHAQELEILRLRLAEMRGRQSEAQTAVVGDLQAQLRERAGEVERLHCDLRSSASEVERLKCEARKLDLRSATCETAAVEAAKAAAAEQWRRDLKRMEEVIRERDAELSAAKEQVERAQRDMRRLEAEEHRSTQRAEATRTEGDNARQEAQQLREDVVEAERRLEDARTALRGEHAARALSEGGLRDAQREMRGLRDQLQQQAAETELLGTEARRERNVAAESEAELFRLQQQVQVKEAELRQLRATTDIQSQQGDSSLRRRVAELTEREQALSERERTSSERDRLCAEAEAALHERRRELRDDLQRLELAGLRAAVSELTPSGSRRSEAAALTQLSSTPRRRGGEVTHDVPPLPVDLLAEADSPLRAAQGHLQAMALTEGTAVAEGKDGGFGVDDGGCSAADVGSPLRESHATRVMGEAASALDARRRELRCERTALEELRKQWKSDLHQAQAGGSVQAQAVLNEIRTVLDERTSSLNKLIDEHRVLERALLMQSSGSKAEPDGAEGTAARNFKVRADTGGAITPSARLDVEEDLMRRWQNLLSPGQTQRSATGASARPKSARPSHAASPHSASGDRCLSSRRTRASRDVVDQHLNWLRSFQRESRRPLSARASTRY